MSGTRVHQAGDRLDRYELLCVLAQGGMGAVWLARLSGMLGFERLYAVKTILTQYAEDPRFRDMFLDEARLTSRIRHENVAQIIDMGEANGSLYYAMEYIDGESLKKIQRDFAAEGRLLPIGVALRVVAEVCAGLHAAHELCDPDGAPLEVVHRDVSPQNVLVTRTGQAKVIDFGVAKARDRLAAETSLGTLKGKVDYMSNEQARNEAIDRRADVYAVGAILYELLAGRAPFETSDGRNQVHTLQQVLTGATPPPLPPGVPGAVSAVVMRAIAHDREARFATALDMRRAIEDAARATGLAATTLDVASAIEGPLRARSTKRRVMVDAALKALAARAEQGERLAVPIESVSGLPAKPVAGSGTHFIEEESNGSLTNASGVLVAPRARRSAALVAVVGIGFVVVGLGAFAMGRSRVPRPLGAATRPVPSTSVAEAPSDAPSDAPLAALSAALSPPGVAESSSAVAPVASTATTPAPTHGPTARTKPPRRAHEHFDGASTTTAPKDDYGF